ncbi:unnamed protein product, partial [Effrenium voratum]
FAWFLSVILHDRLPVLRFSHDFHVVGLVWKELAQAREPCEGEIREHSGVRGGREPLAGAKVDPIRATGDSLAGHLCGLVSTRPLSSVSGFVLTSKICATRRRSGWAQP